MINYKVIGRGPSLIIIHGLFGTMDNWRSMSSMLEGDYSVILVDLRNHGKSFWSQEFNYDLLAEDIIELLDYLKVDRAHILGHSMGGKVAMTLAAKYPERLRKLIVLDIGFKRYPQSHMDIFNAVLALDIDHINSRTEADNQLALSISDLSIRQFLLKGLGRDSNKKFRWKTNFEILLFNYQNILAEVTVEQLETETLFIRGLKSHYITDEDIKELSSKFPKARFASLDAGHWVHAERPKELFDLIRSFLS